MIAVRAEQDIILVDELRPSNVPTHGDHLRVLKQAAAVAKAAGATRLLVRSDSAALSRTRCAGWRPRSTATPSAPT
jgi:hypothetical protein